MAAEEGEIRVQVSGRLTLRDLIVRAGIDYRKVKKTIHDLKSNEDTPIDYDEWEKVKTVLAKVFTKEQYVESKKVPLQIFISPAAWERLQAVWKPNITAIDLQEKLQSWQSPAEREAKLQEITQEGKEEIVRLVHSPCAYFQPVEFGLGALCKALNEINVFNRPFELKNTYERNKDNFAQKKRQSLWMVLTHTPENKKKRDDFVLLLKNCGVKASAGHKEGVYIVAVRGLTDRDKFEKSKDTLKEFAAKHNTEKPPLNPNL